MSVLYLYAIADAGAALDAPGLHGAAVTSIRVGDMEAVVSEHEDDVSLVDSEDLWAHEEVVESAGRGGRAVLPFRAGTLLPDEAAVRDLIEEREADFGRALARVRGAVEVAVRAVVADQSSSAGDEPAARSPGTDYLMQLVARKQQSDGVIARVHRPLAGLARDHARLNGGLGADSSVRLAYLVDRDDLDEFQGRVATLENGLDGIRLVCTGPWPPYSFAEASPQ